MKKKYVIIGIVALVAAGAVVYILTKQKEGQGPHVIGQKDKPEKDPKEFISLLRKSDVAIHTITDCARNLKRIAQENTGFFDYLCQLIQDEKEPVTVRDILAFVLGTFENKKAEEILLSLLTKATDKKEITTLILALGQQKQPSVHEVFYSKSDQNVVKTPQGVYVVIKYPKNLDVLKDLLLNFLKDDDVEVRKAAASSLVFGMKYDDVRKSLKERLVLEADSELKATIGGSLAEWAMFHKVESAERGEIVELLLKEISDAKNQNLRTKSQDHLKRCPMNEKEIDQLLAFTKNTFINEVRLFAMDLLESRVGGEERDKKVFDVLASLLSDKDLRIAGDSDDKIREHAAKVIGLTKTEKVFTKLYDVIMSDPSTNVRIAALEGMGNQGHNPLLDMLLDTLESSENKNTELRAKAREVRKKLLNR